MLRYGIGALLIILIITITLSYHYNAEGFVAITEQAATTAATTAATAAQQAATAAAPAAAAAQQAATAAAPAQQAATAAQATAADIVDSSVGVNAPNPSKQLFNAGHLMSLQDTKPASTANEPTNTERNVKIDKVVITTDSDIKFLYIYASAQLLPSGTAIKHWLITDDANDPANSVIPLSKQVIVTNDSKFKSATIPVSKYAPYAGQMAYLVPRGSLNTDEAVGTFIIPSPSGPTVVNPKVSLSDTGYNAMKFNKQNNLLNDIQKIIHNEMLSHRTLDVSVKNTSSRSRASGAASGAAGAPKGAKSVTSKKSCNNISSGSCDSSARCDDEPDMSKYIRKDQIPCYGCSLDY
jgi:hypothetical protein